MDQSKVAVEGTVIDEGAEFAYLRKQTRERESTQLAQRGSRKARKFKAVMREHAMFSVSTVGYIGVRAVAVAAAMVWIKNDLYLSASVGMLAIYLAIGATVRAGRWIERTAQIVNVVKRNPELIENWRFSR